MANEQNALVKVIAEKKDVIWSARASWLNDVSKEVYFNRALMHISENTDLIRISKTESGARSLMQCIGKALIMGLQIGAHIPQVYIVPMGDKAELIPTAAGYTHIVTTDTPESGKVLDRYVQKAVYEGDDVIIDAMTGEIKHTVCITDKKRKFIGAYAQFTELDGSVHADFISRGDIEQIRDKWSKQPDGKAWKNSFEAMAMQKAAKHFLKPYAARKEALSIALAMNEAENKFEDQDFMEVEVIDEKNVTKDTKKDTKDLFEGWENEKRNI